MVNTGNPRKLEHNDCQSTRNHTNAVFFFRCFSLLLLALLLIKPQASHAQLPIDHTVEHGSAVVDVMGSHMTITNSPDTILEWQAFSIGADHSVHFQQQDDSSQILNRVAGDDPSQIFGSLSSNGGVWLINPQGILFGENARIDVGSLVASTLEITNIDFLANRYQFNSAGNGSGNVLNQGEIRTSFGGHVWMTGEQVRNEGLIQSPQGNIVLAAGKSIELIDSGAPNIKVRVSAPENEAMNLGNLVAPNGQVDVHGSIVNQEGVIRADSITADEAGRIVLKATDNLTVAAGSETTADGIQGGQIRIEGEGKVNLSATLSTVGEKNGGLIEVTGDAVKFVKCESGCFGRYPGWCRTFRRWLARQRRFAACA